MKELEEAEAMDPTGGSNIHLPDIPDAFYEDLLKRRGNVDDYKAMLPENLHDYIDEYWNMGKLGRCQEVFRQGEST